MQKHLHNLGFDESSPSEIGISSYLPSASFSIDPTLIKKPPTSFYECLLNYASFAIVQF